MKRRSKSANAAGHLNKSEDVHEPMVGHSDTSCQLKNVGQPDTAHALLLHTIYRMMNGQTGGGFVVRRPGSRLKALRKAAHLTQDEVAVALGISRSHVAGIENNKDLPGRETLAAFATFYEVSIDHILYDAELPVHPPYEPQLVNDADELAVLNFWRNLDDVQRGVMLKALKSAAPRD